MSEGNFKRAHRVGQLIQQELGRILSQELKDPRVGFVTVTEVRVSDDLRNARVYVSVYGDDEQRESSLKGLQEAAGFLKREIFHRVRLKYAPNIHFSLDNSLDKAQRLETLMTAIAHGEIETPPEDAAPSTVPVTTGRSELAEQARALQEVPVEPPPQEHPTRSHKSKRNKRARKRSGKRRIR